MDKTEQMAADIALAMNGGEWKDGKWYSKGHREAWMKAVQPYADEIEQLREALTLIAMTKNDDIRPSHEIIKMIWLGCTQIARTALKGDE